MNSVIQTMLKRYACKTEQDYTNALKEIIQEVALIGLWRAKFFEEAAFYGGTALRILFQLDRFSEDLDFTLLKRDAKFDLNGYLHAIKNELDAFGFNIHISQKNKTKLSAVQSAFLKGNTLEHLLEIGVPSHTFSKQHAEELIKIKLEVDTDPPPEFETTTHFLLQPISCAIRVVAEPDLFAGKMHALLCRDWKTRVKGRDWYDLLWYVAKGVPLNINHLEMRMRQSGHYSEKSKLTTDKTKQLLQDRIEAINLAQALQDVRPFVRDPETLSVWSKEFFQEVVKRIKFIE